MFRMHRWTVLQLHWSSHFLLNLNRCGDSLVNAMYHFHEYISFLDVRYLSRRSQQRRVFSRALHVVVYHKLLAQLGEADFVL